MRTHTVHADTNDSKLVFAKDVSAVQMKLFLPPAVLAMREILERILCVAVCRNRTQHTASCGCKWYGSCGSLWRSIKRCKLNDSASSIMLPSEPSRSTPGMRSAMTSPHVFWTSRRTAPELRASCATRSSLPGHKSFKQQKR